MKFIKFLVFTTITAAVVWFFERPPSFIPELSQIPPIGRFIDPFHGFWQNVESESTTRSFNEETLNGLQSNVSVLYDSIMIPHVFAQNDEDLYFMQGYLTAKHRLWQMEFQTHAAAGRITEILGLESALDFDKGQRRKGLTFAAKNFTKNIEKSEEMMTITSAYSKGVNAYIKTLDNYQKLPLEYKLLNYKPEEWSIYKCALLLKYMANNLCFGDYDLEYTNALKSYGPEMFALLYPDMLEIQDPIVNGTTEWDFEPVKVTTPVDALPKELIIKDELEDPNPDNGSNNWAVSGSKTKNGYPILSSDPHLQLNLPSIWFVMQLTSPTVNVKGATLPGSPNVIIGFNDSIAWGVTNARRDVVDWYEIEFKENDKSVYKLDGQWKETTKIVEEIKIKGKPSIFDTVYYTQWGPVMYDDSYMPEDNHRNFALRWVAHDPSEEVLAFYKLNRSNNYNDYSNALNHYSSPAQNFAFAASNGDIAMRIQGKFPNKWPQQGKFILDGTRSEMRWQGFIPPEHNVYTINPERGFISSANQHPVDSTYPYYAYAERYEYYRNRRINTLLNSMSNVTVEDLMKLQQDNYNLFASEALDTLLTIINQEELNSEEQEMYNLLEKWNRYNNPEEIAPAYFEAFADALFPLIWDEMRESKYPLVSPNKTNTLQLISKYPNLSFFDILSTPEKESANDVVLRAFKEGFKRVSDWKENHDEELNWSKYKATSAVHLARLPAFSVQNILNGGNHNIVNATSERHGPSWRMVVEITPNGPNAWGVYPGGQSGNPGSKHYDDMIEYWKDGKYFPMPLLTLDDANKASYQIEYTNQ